MKTKFKIILVIGSFVIFYFALIPAMQICLDSGGDCAVLKELILLTRPVIPSDTLIWDTGNGVGDWGGTPDQIESGSLSDHVVNNLPFVVSMIILPFVIIGFVVTLEKKKET